MSCITGIVGLAGCLPDPVWQARGLRAMLPAGDREGLWRGTRAALAWRQFVQVPQDLRDTQPAQGGDGAVVLAFDGRLDNREELASRLRLSNAELVPMADSRLALLCLEQAGIAALGWFCGDYALAFWNDREQSLLLARDALGGRPLVYQQDGRYFRFASVPRGILADADVPRALDPVALASQVMRWQLPADGTIYKGIASVPPGSYLLLRGDRVTVDFHWRPDRIQPQPMGNATDLVDGLRAVIDTAVAARTRSVRPVAAHLSAGLDSGAVAVMAARHLGDASLLAYTAAPRLDFQEDGFARRRLADESRLAARTASLCPNIHHIVLRSAAAYDLEAADRQAVGSDLPSRNAMNAPWLDAIARDAARRGAGVMLAGDGGNSTVSYSGVAAIPDLLLRGRVLAGARALRAFHRQGVQWRPLANNAILPVLSRRLQISPATRRLVRRLPGFGRLVTPALGLLRPDMAAGVADMRGWTWPGRETMADGGLRADAFARNDAAFQAFNYEAMHRLSYRDPMVDRRVVEFCWGLPLEAFLLGGEPRGLMRRAMAGVLPPEVLAEPRRGLQSADGYSQLQAASADLLAECQRIEADPDCQALMDTGQLRSLLAGLSQRPDTRQRRHDLTVTLPQVLAVGRFIRRFNGRNG